MEGLNIKRVTEKEAVKLGEQLSEFVKANVSSSFMASVFDQRFKEYLEKGASVNLDTMFIFNRLIENNKIESLKNYIMAGANVNISDIWNITPLYFALLERRTKRYNRTYRVLLEAGAKVDVVNTMNSSKPTPKALAEDIKNLDEYEKNIFKKYFQISYNEECIN